MIANRSLRGAARRAFAAAFAGLALLVLATPAARAIAPEEVQDDWDDEPRWSLTASTGVDFASGDYGSADTTRSFYFPFGLKFEYEPIIVKVTVPYLLLDGDGSFVGGGDGGIVIGGANLFSDVNHGIGDVIAAVTYVYYPTVRWLPIAELTGKVKFPTADEDDNLGTGEFDYTLQFDASKSFGPVTPFGTIGYRFMGDPPGVDLSNYLFASAGLGFRLSDRIRVGGIYDWRENSSASAKDTHEAVAYASFDIGERWSFDPYGLVGLSKYAPDWGVGFQIGVTFGRR